MTVVILIDFALFCFYNVLLLRIIVSLLQAFAGFDPPPALRPAANFLFDITEPFLRLFRGLLPGLRLGGMGLDLSPILAFIVVGIARAAIGRIFGL